MLSNPTDNISNTWTAPTVITAEYLSDCLPLMKTIMVKDTVENITQDKKIIASSTLCCDNEPSLLNGETCDKKNKVSGIEMPNKKVKSIFL